MSGFLEGQLVTRPYLGEVPVARPIDRRDLRIRKSSVVNPEVIHQALVLGVRIVLGTTEPKNVIPAGRRTVAHVLGLDHAAILVDLPDPRYLVETSRIMEPIAGGELGNVRVHLVIRSTLSAQAETQLGSTGEPGHPTFPSAVTSRHLRRNDTPTKIGRLQPNRNRKSFQFPDVLGKLDVIIRTVEIQSITEFTGHPIGIGHIVERAVGCRHLVDRSRTGRLVKAQVSDQAVGHAGDLEQISGHTGHRLVRTTEVEGSTGDVAGRRKGHVGVPVGNA